MEKDFYWTLTVEPNWVQAAVWTLADEKAHVFAVSNPVRWETATDLVDAADSALSSVVQELPQDAPEPSASVFGVSPAWVENGEIKKERLEQLGEICKKLSLTPTGFVVLPEAIAHYYKVEEKAPISAVIIGVNEATLDMALFKLGNLSGTIEVNRSVSVVDDLVEGLTRFGFQDSLPSRFLIYDGKSGDLEDARQAIVEADWSSLGTKTKLLHPPKVEVVDPQKKAVAVSLAGASEIGEAKSIAFDAQDKSEELEKISETDDEVLPASQAGFVAGDVNEVATTGGPPSEQKFEEPAPTPPLKPRKRFGFLANLKKSLTGLFGRVGPVFQPKTFGSKRLLFIGLGVFLAALVAGFVAWWFLPKAVVTVYVAPQKLEETQVIEVDTETSTPDYDAQVLPGKLLTTTASGERTASTTGAKNVGERAKGKVTIRNGTSAPVKLSSGDVLVGPNDLEFTVDESASVSAAVSPSSPGEESVEVTAAAIGSEYNLAKDETFKVTNYPKSEVDAIAEADFSGGSSREISAVSESDREDLEEDLIQELTSQGEQEIGEGVKEGSLLIPEALAATASAKNFNHKVGDEADTLKLSMDLKVEGLVVQKDHLIQLAKESVASRVPQGFVLKDEQIETEFSLEEREGDIWQVEVVFKINLLPEVKPEEIAKLIAGKYPAVAKNYLSSIPGFSRAEVHLNPKLPGKLGVLPRVTKNLEIEIAAEQ